LIAERRSPRKSCRSAPLFPGLARHPALASDPDAFSVVDECVFHGGRLVDEGLGSEGHSRRWAEPCCHASCGPLGRPAPKHRDLFVFPVTTFSKVRNNDFPGGLPPVSLLIG
jgi:hypothetical protein